jgi:hypothetical protein
MSVGSPLAGRTAVVPRAACGLGAETARAPVRRPPRGAADFGGRADPRPPDPPKTGGSRDQRGAAQVSRCGAALCQVTSRRLKNER